MEILKSVSRDISGDLYGVIALVSGHFLGSERERGVE